MSKKPTILLHLPAYRDPELIPTIEDALEKAKYPKRVHFGICRQYHPEDGFDDLTKYKKDKRFKIYECLYTEAKGLPWARSIINEQLLDDEDYVCQLDSHHRFAEDWDETLIQMHIDLEKKGHKKPIIAGYSPLYNPFTDPLGRSMEPWQSQFVCFYPHGTIFIRPGLLHGYQNMTEPPMSRFLCGHFDFARSEWAREIKHDPNIYFAGEEINLTVRSYTHGYDFFHPHKIVVWHSTMREERSGMLKWDDDAKHGVSWWQKQEESRKRIRVLLGSEEDPNIDLTGYDLGTVRTLRDYEKYAGVHFKRRAVQKYTIENNYPPNPHIQNDELWEQSFMGSFYHLITIQRNDFPRNNYKHILVAFDNEEGKPVHTKYIEGRQLEHFMTTGTSIHYEEYFLTDEKPFRVVFWGFTEEDGWVERVDYKI
jgi:glycosyltransferase involved in cell wall biosynthesis